MTTVRIVQLVREAFERLPEWVKIAAFMAGYFAVVLWVFWGHDIWATP